jgi:hypothetical protein
MARLSRERPQTLVVMGYCSLGFAVTYLGWLLLYHAGDIVDMLAAALGNGNALDSLLRKHLAQAHAVFLTLLTVGLEAVLMAILVACGYGLLTVQGWARWCALFFAAVVVPVALLHTVLHLAWLTGPQQPLRITPLMMDAVVIQFAIVLGGTMFLPSVTAAYQPDLEGETRTDGARP